MQFSTKSVDFGFSTEKQHKNLNKLTIKHIFDQVWFKMNSVFVLYIRFASKING